MVFASFFVNLTKGVVKGIIDTYGILFHKIPKSLMAFCGLATTVSIDGVVKMPLQASIFTPGRICLASKPLV